MTLDPLTVVVIAIPALALPMALAYCIGYVSGAKMATKIGKKALDDYHKSVMETLCGK